MDLNTANFALSYSRICEYAKDQGVPTMGGGCWSFAVAANRVIFGEKGSLVAGLNTALQERGVAIGHAAILFNGEYWDGDGEPKEMEEIESWGMLDEQDTDYKEYFSKHGIKIVEENFATSHIYEFESEAEFCAVTHCCMEDVEWVTEVLERAIEWMNSQSSALSNGI